MRRRPGFKKILVYVCVLLTAGFADANGQYSSVSVSVSRRWAPGKVILYRNQWVKLVVGNMPLVISVPHGGFMKPESIPDRDCKGGRMVRVTDSKTIQAAQAISDAFFYRFHKRPYLIVSNIARTKVDQNREEEFGTCGNKQAGYAWADFHNGIDTALALAVKQFGYALYIDLHGQGHKNRRLELGYSFSGPQLREMHQHDGDLGAYGRKSSLQNLLKSDHEATFRDLLWGKYAFGTLMYKEDIPATPSMQDHYPAEGEPFFSGGYNTRRYTSSSYPDVFGWQIECNYVGVRDTKTNRMAFAKAFVSAYAKFLWKYEPSETK